MTLDAFFEHGHNMSHNISYLMNNINKTEYNSLMENNSFSFIENTKTRKTKSPLNRIQAKVEYISAVDIINLIFMLVGIFTNLVCICIFSRKCLLKKKFNWYLLVLAILELIFCFVLFCDYAFRIMISSKTIFLHELNMNLTILMDFMTHATDSLTIIITLILSIDRLYAITNPIKNKYFITNTHTKTLLIYSFLIVCAIRLPSSIVCQFICHNESNTICMIYCSFLLPALVNILPALLILIINIILVCKLLNYNMQRLSIRNTRDGKTYLITSTRNKKIRKSRYFIILTMGLWLLMTNAPYYAIFIYQFGLLDAHLKNEHYFRHTFNIQHVISVLFNMNHCINFFIYMCYHEVFRTAFFIIFKIKACTRDYRSIILRIQSDTQKSKN